MTGRDGARRTCRFLNWRRGKWIVGTVAAVLVGVRTGVRIQILAVPLMVLAVGDARQSAGWLLPLLLRRGRIHGGHHRRRAYARSLLLLLLVVLMGWRRNCAG